MLERLIGGVSVLGVSLLWWKKSKSARQVKLPEMEVVPPDPVDFEGLTGQERTAQALKGGEVIR